MSAPPLPLRDLFSEMRRKKWRMESLRENDDGTWIASIRNAMGKVFGPAAGKHVDHAIVAAMDLAGARRGDAAAAADDFEGMLG